MITSFGPPELVDTLLRTVEDHPNEMRRLVEEYLRLQHEHEEDTKMMVALGKLHEEHETLKAAFAKERKRRESLQAIVDQLSHCTITIGRKTIEKMIATHRSQWETK